MARVLKRDVDWAHDTWAKACTWNIEQGRDPNVDLDVARKSLHYNELRRQYEGQTGREYQRKVKVVRKSKFKGAPISP